MGVQVQGTATDTWGKVVLPDSRSLQLDPQKDLLIEKAIENITPISRGFQGVSDTSVSPDKKGLKYSGPDLVAKVRGNFRRAFAYTVQEIGQEIHGPLDVQRIFETSARILNEDLLDAELPFYRTWDRLDRHVPVSKITEALGEFHTEYLKQHRSILDALQSGAVDLAQERAIRLAAYIEKRYNHEIHPLYDGCGKCSKDQAVAVLALAGLTYPRFSDREGYIALRGKPLEEWIEVYRDRIEAI